MVRRHIRRCPTHNDRDRATDLVIQELDLFNDRLLDQFEFEVEILVCEHGMIVLLNIGLLEFLFYQSDLVQCGW